METDTLAEASPPQSLTQRLFRGHDPFTEFSPDPFRSGGAHRVFGSSFGRVLQGLEDLSERITGVRPVLPQQEPAPLPGATRYSVQTASMSSFMGADGQVHTEQFASSDVGDRTREIRETHQAYSNSETGEHKRALEQHLGQRGKKTVRLRGGQRTVEESNEMLMGMDGTAEAKELFDKEFESQSKHLPEHMAFGGGFFSGFGTGSFQGLSPLPGSGRWRQGALESGSAGGA
eukprot:TRINITY_DN10417_c1_g1_i1.p1 TRINITY_DN10417_c1_g1~~TRINITY_DN10417_c1_g1_i1.p1  ORF type:complete len:266 (-),score=40.60 TRINITY_DN10417_c1_g1_i1:88-783(-)